MATFIEFTHQELTAHRRAIRDAVLLYVGASWDSRKRSRAIDALAWAELACAITTSQQIHLSNYMTFVKARRNGIVPKKARFQECYSAPPRRAQEGVEPCVL